MAGTVECLYYGYWGTTCMRYGEALQPDGMFGPDFWFKISDVRDGTEQHHLIVGETVAVQE